MMKQLRGIDRLDEKRRIRKIATRRTNTFKRLLQTIVAGFVGSSVALMIVAFSGLPRWPYAIVVNFVCIGGTMVLWARRYARDDWPIVAALLREEGRCEDCGYDMAGTHSKTCPECGHGQDGSLLTAKQ